MLPIHKTRLSVYNYDDIPAGYYFEAMLSGKPSQRFWHRMKFAEVATRIKDGSNVLDIGCGPGSFLYVLGEEKKNVTATGIDIASRQIKFAKEHISTKFEDGRISFKQVSAGVPKLPFEDNTFDTVTNIEVIEHIHPHVALLLLQEANRVLKPGGKIIVTTPNYRSMWPLLEFLLERLSPVKYHEQHVNKYTPNSFAKFLETMGFEINTINSIFIVAPFLSGISEKLAKFVHYFETSVNHGVGSILCCEATKVDWQKKLQN